MSRQFPLELHVGQTVLVRPSPTTHPIEALVTHLDRFKGIIHVKPIGYKVKWRVRVRAISSLTGLHLHHENERFTFKEAPFFA